MAIARRSTASRSSETSARPSGGTGASGSARSRRSRCWMHRRSGTACDSPEACIGSPPVSTRRWRRCPSAAPQGTPAATRGMLMPTSSWPPAAEMPKSVSLGLPYSVTRMLAGLMSRCRIRHDAWSRWPPRDLDPDAQGVGFPPEPFGAMPHLQVGLGAVLHDEVRPAVVGDSGLVDGDDRRVVGELRHHVRLFGEARDGRRGHALLEEHLHRDGPARVRLLVEEDVGEAAGSEQPDALEARDDGGGVEGGR